MTTNIWQKTLKEEVFTDYSEEQYNAFLQLYTEYFSYGVSQGKAWADWSFLQDLIMSYLTQTQHMNNKMSILLALLFRDIFDETLYASVSSSTNIEALSEFLDELQELHQMDLHKYKKGSTFLLLNTEFNFNDVLLLNDFEVYQNIVNYHAPYEVRPGIFGVVKDETKFSFKFKKTKYNKEQLHYLVEECLQGMKLRSVNILDDNMRSSYDYSVNHILSNVKNLRAH